MLPHPSNDSGPVHSCGDVRKTSDDNERQSSGEQQTVVPQIPSISCERNEERDTLLIHGGDVILAHAIAVPLPRDQLLMDHLGSM